MRPCRPALLGESRPPDQPGEQPPQAQAHRQGRRARGHSADPARRHVHHEQHRPGEREHQDRHAGRAEPGGDLHDEGLGAAWEERAVQGGGRGEQGRREDREEHCDDVRGALEGVEGREALGEGQGQQEGEEDLRPGLDDAPFLEQLAEVPGDPRGRREVRSPPPPRGVT